MSKSKQARTAVLSLAAVFVIASLVAAPAGADKVGQVVTIKSTLSINPYGSAGKVSSPNANCVEERTVVVKEKGVGKIGSATTNANGGWKAEPKYKGPLPYKLYAEAKPVSQGTAGTIYKCLGATSKTVTINGG